MTEALIKDESRALLVSAAVHTKLGVADLTGVGVILDLLVWAANVAYRAAVPHAVSAHQILTTAAKDQRSLHAAVRGIDAFVAVLLIRMITVVTHRQAMVFVGALVAEHFLALMTY